MNYLYEQRPFNDLLTLRHICHDILTTEFSPGNLWECNKEHSNDFTFVFVDGRNHEFTQIEYLAAFKSCKLFSKYNYKILAFVPNTTNFLDNRADLDNWRVKIIPIGPIKSHNEYSEFMVRELPWLIPGDSERLIFYQSDGFLVKNGWESFLAKGEYNYIGAAWKHCPRLEFFHNGEWRIKNGPLNNVGNGGFSARSLTAMRNMSKLFKNIPIREFGGDPNRFVPEDVFYSQVYNWGGHVASQEEANKFSIDPYTLDMYKNKEKYSFGMHFPTHK